MKHCKNCETAIQDLYCPHCGQKAKVDRITFPYLCTETLHLFTHIEKGFLFTSWSMLARPGITVKNFIDGKRKVYQSPLSYFLVWTTIYILFLYWIERTFGENVVINYKEYFGPSTTTKFAISHLSLVLMIIIPFQAFYLYMLVTKKKYYYFETMIAAIYSLGTIILLQFVFAILALLIHFKTGTSIDLRLSDPQKVIFLVWFISDFIKLFSIKLKWLRVLVFAVLAFGTFTL